MILMRVGQHQPGEIAPLLDEERDVRHDQVDAGQVVARERDAEIDREPRALAAVAEAVEREIHPDLADAAERREHQFRLGHYGETCAGNISPAVIASSLPGGQPQHQPARPVEGLERAGEFAIGKPHDDIAADPGRMRQPLGADGGESLSRDPIAQDAQPSRRRVRGTVHPVSPRRPCTARSVAG